MTERILAVRNDSIGDVLLTEPALRALSHEGEVTLLCSPAGVAAAALIDAVSDVIVHSCPWIEADPAPVDAESVSALVETLAERRFDRAVVFTSGRQSPLPTALVLRLAGIRAIAARSETYAGSLLDVRLRDDPECHEVERNLEVVEAFGIPAPFDRRIRVRRSGVLPVGLPAGAVVVHPGATAPARTPEVEGWTDVVTALAAAGRAVVLTGSTGDVAAGVLRSHPGVALDLVGATDLGELAEVIGAASAICVGNTGPMHLAAAVGTPTVALFPATVPLVRWRPWMVEHVVLGDHTAPCAPCYQRVCTTAGRPCLPVRGEDVVAAVESLVGRPTAVEVNA